MNSRNQLGIAFLIFNASDRRVFVLVESVRDDRFTLLEEKNGTILFMLVRHGHHGIFGL